MRTPTPTDYNGVRFRSKTEAAYARMFDLAKLEWKYEPEGFFEGTPPDFITLGRGVESLVEVKPAVPTDAVLEQYAVRAREWVHGQSQGRKREALIFVGSPFSGEPIRLYKFLLDSWSEMEADEWQGKARHAKAYRFDLKQEEATANNGGITDPDALRCDSSFLALAWLAAPSSIIRAWVLKSESFAYAREWLEGSSVVMAVLDCPAMPATLEEARAMLELLEAPVRKVLEPELATVFPLWTQSEDERIQCVGEILAQSRVKALFREQAKLHVELSVPEVDCQPRFVRLREIEDQLSAIRERFTFDHAGLRPIK